MSLRDNPYATPKAECDAPAALSEIRRPPFGTFLIVIWLLEGSFKTFLIGKGLASGFNPLPIIVREYQQTSWWLFLLVSAFLAIETIGPWVGIYYLTGSRARTLPFESALYRTLKVAGTTAIATTILLMLYCQIVAT